MSDQLQPAMPADPNLGTTLLAPSAHTWATASGTLQAPPAPAPAPTSVQREPGWWARVWDRLGGGPGRIAGIDLARGLAVLGMIAAHTASLPDLNWTVPSSWIGIAAGRSSILFATLAGVSMAIMTGGRTLYVGRRGLDARIRILVRACVLLVFGGILQAVAGMVALILEYYALMFLLGLIFVRWPIRRLAIAIAVAVPAGVMAVLYGQHLLDNLGGAGLAQDGSGFWQWAVTGMYPVLAWMPFCLTGILLGRLDLARLRTAGVICLSGLVAAGVGYGVSAAFGITDSVGDFAVAFDDGGSSSGAGSMVDLSQGGEEQAGTGMGANPGDSGLWGTPLVPAPPADQLVCESDPMGGVNCYDRERYLQWMNEEQDYSWDAGTSWTWPSSDEVTDKIFDSWPHSAGMMEVLGSGGFAVFVIGLCLLIARPARYVAFPVMAVGAMALSAYVTHIILIDLVQLTHWYDSWSPGLFYLVIAGSVIVAATVWRGLLGRGPLERAMGWITRKASSEPAARAHPAAGAGQHLPDGSPGATPWQG